MIFVWDAATAERKYFMTLPTGSVSVSALALSPDGKYLVASDMSDDYKMHLFDLTGELDKYDRCKRVCLWEEVEESNKKEIFGTSNKKQIFGTSNKKQIFGRSNKKQIFGIRWNPSDYSEFVSVGDQHLYFWNVSKNAKKSVDVNVGFVAVAYNQSGTVFTAGSDG